MSDNESVLIDAYPPLQKLTELSRQADEAVERLWEAHRRAIARCKHAVVFECDYPPSKSGLFPPIAPIRKCARCGAEQDMWDKDEPVHVGGKAYWADLSHAQTVIEISRDALMKRRFKHGY